MSPRTAIAAAATLLRERAAGPSFKTSSAPPSREASPAPADSYMGPSKDWASSLRGRDTAPPPVIPRVLPKSGHSPVTAVAAAKRTPSGSSVAAASTGRGSSGTASPSFQPTVFRPARSAAGSPAPAPAAPRASE
jgi:hypothetical protein